MAGGIYISLVLLFSFLSIETMEKVTIDGFTFDPLALLSILVALIQPIVQYLIKTRKVIWREIDAVKRFSGKADCKYL